MPWIKHIEKELYDLKVIVSKLTGNYTLCFDSNYECKF